MLDIWRGKERARSWPKKRGKKLHPKVADQNEWFRQAQWATKYMPAKMYWQVAAAVQGSPLLPRDILTMMLAGRLAAFHLPDGRILWSKEVANDVSTALDVISDQPGAMLVRGEAGWQALLPGEPGLVLKTQGPGQLPIWDEGGGGGGGGNGVLLAEVVTIAGQNVVHFDVDPSFSGLRIIADAGTVSADGGLTQWAKLQFNGDTAANRYGWTLQGSYHSGNVYGVGSNTDVGAGAILLPSMGIAGIDYGLGRIDIGDYRNNRKKRFNAQSGGWQSNVGALNSTAFGTWQGTDPITTIDIRPSASNYAVGSRFRLYGV